MGYITRKVGNATFVETDTPQPPITAYSISLRDFLKRFTAAERESLQEILMNGTAVQQRKLGAFKDYLMMTGDVELNDDYIISSVNLMEQGGVLAAGRAAEILTP